MFGMSLQISINESCSKSIETEAVIAKIEMNKEMLIFFKIVFLLFNTFILQNVPLVITDIPLLMWYEYSV